MRASTAAGRGSVRSLHGYSYEPFRDAWSGAAGGGGSGSLAARGHVQRSQAPILIAACRNRKASEVVFGVVPFPMLLLPPAVMFLSSYPW